MINKITSDIHQLHFSQFGSCVYLLNLNNQNILIDTSTEENQQELINDLKQLNITPDNINIILLTHDHWDHNANISLFPNATLYKYDNIDQLPINQIKPIKTPGHTFDSLVFLYQDILFSGDTLFNNGIGRTDLPESQPEKMQTTLKMVRNLPFKTLCPGHI